MNLENMKNLLGQKIYALVVGQVSSSMHWNYAYRIYPVEMTISEIRFGEARRESDADFYGPGFVTWLCQNSKGSLYAFSPVRDEILSKYCFAGRNTRAFFNKDDLYLEAEVLKELILKKYKDVSRVEIALPERREMLDSKIQDACARAETGFFVVKDNEKIGILK